MEKRLVIDWKVNNRIRNRLWLWFLLVRINKKIKENKEVQYEKINKKRRKRRIC